MYFFVKSELPSNLVDQFTRRLASGQIKGVEGNLSYVTPDGRTGYDVVDCRDENECHQRYRPLTQEGLKIIEIIQIAPMAEFLSSYGKGRERAV